MAKKKSHHNPSKGKKKKGQVARTRADTNRPNNNIAPRSKTMKPKRVTSTPAPQTQKEPWMSNFAEKRSAKMGVTLALGALLATTIFLASTQ